MIWILKAEWNNSFFFPTFSLLSNAGLPETNPLLLDQDLDSSVSEDFQKMLNEWENHIGSLQVSYYFSVKTFLICVPFHDFFLFLQSSDIPDVDLMVPSEVSASTSSTTLTTSNVILKPHGNGEDQQHQNQHQQPQLQTIRDEKAGQSKMTLGQMALAGIVISSGPGDHFETFEG